MSQYGGAQTAGGGGGHRSFPHLHQGKRREALVGKVVENGADPFLRVTGLWYKSFMTTYAVFHFRRCFPQDAYPDMKTVVSDLSPFYLARARENVSYWKRTRQPGRSLGGVDDTGTEFLQSAAEALAAPDESFDVVRAGGGLPGGVQRSRSAGWG